MRATVVGGGIGGLAVAAGLERGGWRVEVLERAPEFGAVGAGISLWANGLSALDALGLGEGMRAGARFDVAAGLRDRRGRWLLRAEGEPAPETVMVHRADLLAALLGAVPARALRPGTVVHSVRRHGTGMVVAHSRGESEADLVIGADGLRSAVRAACWPDAAPPRYTGVSAWRLVLRIPGALDLPGGETWCRGGVFGLFPMAPDRIYCYATAITTEGEVGGDQLDRLRRHAEGWPEPMPTVLRAARPGDVLRNDLYTLPPLPCYVAGNAVLIGDAAHAMPPYLGQGGNQALEDAVTLAALLSGATQAKLPAALAEYDRVRRPRARSIVRRALRAGAVNHFQAPPLVALRDLAVRLTPPRLFLRGYADILDWRAPVIERRAG